jgi:DNA-binding transcriptional MerR regulator/methylmalonyl-CoA mutase cobalamin-binding subunit
MVSPPQEHLASIGQVERDTGVSKDTLRVWERRYGFPQPARVGGERRYRAVEVERLRLIKRLIDGGGRPGQLMGKTLSELEQLARQPAIASRPQQADWLALLRAHDTAELERRLAQNLMQQGVRAFISGTLAPLNETVGHAWAEGHIAIFEEHLYSEAVQRLLRSVIASLPGRSHGPRVLLTTLPKEQHGIGTLMVEALLAAEGVPCIALGPQTPVPDIVAAVAAHRADVVALSFSAHFNANGALAALTRLRESLPERVGLWIGGRLTQRLRNLPEGVVRLHTFDALESALRDWRDAAPPTRT